MNISHLQEIFLIKAKQALKDKGYKVDENQLFNGSFGFVFFIQDSSQNDLAVKVISLNKYSEGTEVQSQLLSDSIQEAHMISNLRHPRIVKYVSHFQEGTIFFIIMERALMTLDNYFEKNFSSNKISEEQFFNFAGQLIDGISFLHKKGIILRDFKPSNVLVFQDNQLKLSDFGLSKRFSPLLDMDEYKQSSLKGSYMYFPPEIMQIINSSELSQDSLIENSVNQTMKGDIWALGITFVQILGMKPFTSIALSCGYTEFTEEPQATPKMNQFLRQILKKEPDERPTIENLREILCDEYPKYKSNMLMKKAILLRDKELDFEEAEMLLRRAIKEDPTNSYAYSNLALSFWRRQDSYLDFKIQKNIQIALQLNPYNEEAIMVSSFLEKNGKESEKLRKKALSINNQNPFILNSFGSELMNHNKFDEAEQFFKLAIKADEDYGRAYCFLGELNRKKKQFDVAISWYQQGIGRDYADSILLTAIGIILIDDLDQKSFGEIQLNISVRLNQRCNFAKYQLGKYYSYDEENYEKSLPYFQDLVQSCPGNSDYRYELARNLCNLEKYNEAEDQIRESIKISQLSSNLIILGIVTGDQGKIGESIDAFEKAIELFPNDASAHCCYAEYLEKFGKLKESLIHYQKSEELEHNEENLQHISRLKIIADN